MPPTKPKSTKPRKGTIKRDDDSEKLNVHLHDFLEDFRAEVNERYGRIVESARTCYDKIISDVTKQYTMLLAEEIVDMNLFEFIRFSESKKNTENSGSIIGAQFEGNEHISIDAFDVESDENDDDCNVQDPCVINIKEEKDHNCINPTIGTVTTKKTDQFAAKDTIKRAPYPNRLIRELNMKTPSGHAFRVPALITPKVNDLNGNRFRKARHSEVAFSINGSPIVMSSGSTEVTPGENPSALLHELLMSDEQSLTPDSRQICTNLKALMWKKMGVESVESDLD